MALTDRERNIMRNALDFPHMVNVGRPCDNECGGISASVIGGLCADCVEYEHMRQRRR